VPEHWTFPIAIHFAHRAMAVVLLVALPIFTWAVRRDRAASLAMRAGASALLTLLVLQILLGALVILTRRGAETTTAHVVVGALTLAVTFWLTWSAHRDAIEGPAPLATPTRS
jgi:cytochrome c oxidase assembly protein subunit 15